MAAGRGEGNKALPLRSWQRLLAKAVHVRYLYKFGPSPNTLTIAVCTKLHVQGALYGQRENQRREIVDGGR